ncbi:MAG TPA: DUF445 family protein [Bacillota bacterium]|jgi:uncharacterized membrane protein YheB (UPF0754 family)
MTPLQPAELLALPILGALLGGFAAFIAVKSLFWPARPVRLPILGWRIQGLIPGHQEEAAKALGRLVEERVLSRPDLYAKLVDPVLRGELVGSLAAALETRVRALVPGIIPAFAATAVAALVRRVAQRELGSLLGLYLDRLASRVEGGLGLGKLVEDRVMALSPNDLEELVKGLAGPQLRWVQALGVLFGLVVGLGQAVLIWPLVSR